MNKLKVKNIDINDNCIIYNYEITGEWRKYFNKNEKFFIEYSESIGEIPYGVAIIPFLCNVLPIAWIFNAEIVVDEIDKEFYLSIPNFKEGYINMYPKVDFLGEINPKKVVDYRQEDSKESLCFFSGGVDAFHTFLSNIDERPSIATVWGADIKLNDVQGWNKVLNHTINTSKIYSVDNKWIKSNFKKFIKEDELTKAVYERAKDGWWHGFQHGIGLIGLAAPITYKNNISKIYIAASFTIKEKGKVTCASDPTIDNNLKFCGCTVEHHGYEANRQDKIKFICEYSKKDNVEIPLRVCWQSSGGSNCCRCEKCYRTIFGLISEKQDPRNFGFNYQEHEVNRMIKHLKNKIIVRESNWKYIQSRFRENYKLDELDKELHWLYKKEISYINNNFNKKCYKFMSKLKRSLVNIKGR